MRYVELCFHERDALAADLAVRGLTEAGLCVLRRPATDAHAPAASKAAERRVMLHSPALAALPAEHPIFAAEGPTTTVAVPIGPHWPLRASRPWLIAPASAEDMRGTGFWRIVAWATTRVLPTREDRIAAQQAVFRALKAGRRGVPVMRRRKSLIDRLDIHRPVANVRGARDWEAAVTPMAVAATLVVAAGASALAIDAAARTETWGSITQMDAGHSDPGQVEAAPNPFSERRSQSP